YRAYRHAVRGWLPRWRPHVADPAVLWVSESCGLCASTGQAVVLAGPRGVEVRAAERAPVQLNRMRFSAAGVDDRGVAALARCLERVSLPWAWLGWLVRLPVLDVAVQAVADACGLGPRELPRSARTVSP
ncbi:MAG: isoprenylcysteine carboxylmethyltransferase family protein, partial [Micrococcales bacterium]|nr:isoprenylcysteine carboxylmethyltransferase family protein [Micrococcales bacterium]